METSDILRELWPHRKWECPGKIREDLQICYKMMWKMWPSRSPLLMICWSCLIPLDFGFLCEGLGSAFPWPSKGCDVRVSRLRASLRTKMKLQRSYTTLFFLHLCLRKTHFSHFQRWNHFNWTPNFICILKDTDTNLNYSYKFLSCILEQQNKEHNTKTLTAIFIIFSISCVLLLVMGVLKVNLCSMTDIFPYQ